MLMTLQPGTRQRWSAVALATAMACAPHLAIAQTVQKPKAEAAKKDTGAALKAYEAGVKSYQAGKFDPAVQSLSAALQGGGLQSQQMAKALLYRGIAYRKQGKPAQAISDLTSAVWLKNGLTDADRSEAMENRLAAFREAGVKDAPAEVATSAGPTPAAATPPAGAPPTAASPPPAATPASPSAPTSSGAALPWQTATSDAASPNQPGSSPATAPAPVLSAAPVEQSEPAAAASSGSSTIGGFFSNLFSGGGSSSTPTGETSAIAKAPPAETQSPPTPDPALSSWSSSTNVTEARRPQRIAAASPVEATPAPKASAKGKYRLQVAAVRSREEADQLVAKLRSDHGSSLGDAAPIVDEAVLGNMGTFYRIQIGPYQTAEQPKQVCQSLKASGYDCLMITQ